MIISNFLSDLARSIFVFWSWWCDGLTQSPTTRVSPPTLLAATFLAISLIAWLIKKPFTSHVPPLPPGPPGLPLLGNLPFLETDHHRYLAKLSEIYGPIMKLQLGRKLCVVISSPSLAKQVLKDHDAIFANRDPPIAGVITAYGGHDIAWSPNNPEWRKLRKIFVQEMMSKTSLDACHALRRQEVREMVKEVYAKVGSAINIGDQMFITILNVIMNMSWGGSLHGEERIRVGIQFRQVVEEVVELLGAPNISDLFPALARFDLQGVESKTKKLLSWFDRIFESLIDGRAKDCQDCGEKKEGKAREDFLEILLELKQNGDGKSSLSMNQVKALLMDIVVGGTHTSSTTIEWAMTELLQHPETMRKACEELEQVVGNNNIVEEFHLSKLRYLDAILKETFRLRPPLPLLVPRSPCTTQTISEYTIPKGSRIFFNAWAMQRDPKAWESPLEFQPERFMRDAGKGEYRGNNFNYLPFGSGRRICPGISLAEKMLMYVLATLLHSFEWKLPEGTELDLSEKFGLVLKKKEPLIAIPKAKLSSLEHYY
ncbi:hypothetical protein EZV62_005688 [Acer yangbiense]|uniref:Cytochrome P450 n=1 Tax=Acer yangbiense TaxID=1000413 RepID=A0A5C7IN29_9ROSI|nr:hypothetical protein EZV62_005688 [Acer yangbiense]